MLATVYATDKIPNRWIGVRADWMLYDRQPWRHLIDVEPSELRTHALVIGATGSGKTNLLHHLIAQDLERGHSVAVLDMRGDLVNAVIELCATRVPPNKVKPIDLREKQRPFGFNPLFGHGEPYFRALNVLDVVAAESESWGVQLAESLRNALLLLAETGEPLTRLEALFYDGPYRDRCLDRCQTEGVIGFWERYAHLSPDRQSGLAGPVLNKVSLLLATPTLRQVLGSSHPIDLGTHLATPGSVTPVSLAVDELHAAGRMMGCLILSSICREIFAQVQTNESARNPVRLYVDEFEHFGLAEFETILAEGRRFGLSVVLAHQTLAQLSPRVRSMILNNVGLKFAFRSGREDSAALSRDLFGDPRSYDLTELPTGYALLWRRNQATAEVEVNEPLIRDSGGLSTNARRYLDFVYSSVQGTVLTSPSRPSPRFEGKGSSCSGPLTASKLEDWLCE